VDSGLFLHEKIEFMVVELFFDCEVVEHMQTGQIWSSKKTSTSKQKEL
jgi:hypothetical protein